MSRSMQYQVSRTLPDYCCKTAALQEFDKARKWVEQHVPADADVEVQIIVKVDLGREVKD